jgi:archaetidylinositol phosphate synthase
MDLNYPLTRYVYRPLSRPLASFLARTAVTPAELTWASTALACAGGVCFAFRAYLLGVALVLIGQIADCADGDLARLTHRTSRTGAYLDSVLDRWTDAALIIGLGFSDLDRYGTVAAFALIGAFLTSYTRARAQSLGADCPEGLATRDVRMLIVMVAALSGQVLIGLWTVAILGFITSVHRMILAMRALGRFDRHDRDLIIEPVVEAAIEPPLAGPEVEEAS